MIFFNWGYPATCRQNFVDGFYLNSSPDFRLGERRTLNIQSFAPGPLPYTSAFRIPPSEFLVLSAICPLPHALRPLLSAPCPMLSAPLTQYPIPITYYPIPITHYPIPSTQSSFPQQNRRRLPKNHLYGRQRRSQRGQNNQGQRHPQHPPVHPV